VRLVDLERSRVLQAFSGKSAVFSADGQTLALLDRDQIKLYDVSSGKFLQTLEQLQAVSSLQFAPDGRSWQLWGWAGQQPGRATSSIWQLPDGKRTVVDIQDPLELTYAPNEGTLLIWTAESIHVLIPIPLLEWRHSMNMEPMWMALPSRRMGRPWRRTAATRI
jgi:WD40 repeat protein